MIPLSHRTRFQGAFSLIELLTVVAIIAILAALVLSTSGFIQEKASRARAETEIAGLESALANYKADFGSFPEGDGSRTSSKELIEALSPESGKVYFEIPTKMLGGYDRNKTYQSNLADADFLSDPFGNPYYYYFDASNSSGTNPVTSSVNNGPTHFDLWSVGKQKRASNPNPERYITNW